MKQFEKIFRLLLNNNNNLKVNDDDNHDNECNDNRNYNCNSDGLRCWKKNNDVYNNDNCDVVEI